MLVKELIEHLKSMNQEALVVLSGDSEGNAFSPADDAFGVDEWFDEDDMEIAYLDDRDDDPDTEGLTPCIIIWSTR